MINATSIIIQNGTGDIVGQMEMTLSFVGEPIDISNKSFDDWVILLDSELSIKQLQISGTIVYNNDAQYKKVREDAFNGTLDTYTIIYVIDSVVTEMFVATMMPNGVTDALPHGDKVATSLTLLSSGTVSVTVPPVFALVTELYPIIAIEDKPMTGSVIISYINDIPIIFEVPVMGGTVLVDQVVIETFTIIEYEEIEKEMVGSVLIDSVVTETFTIIEYEETEKEMTGSVVVTSIIQTDVLVSADETEKEMTGSVVVESVVIT